MTLEQEIVEYAVKCGFSNEDAERLLASVRKGNRGAHTEAFRNVLRNYFS